MLEVGLKKLLVFILWLALFPFLSGCDTIEANASPVAPGHLVMERITLPAQFENWDGSRYMVNLDALVVRPDDNQVHPLAVINHGYEPINHGSMSLDEFQGRAMEFARRGWVAVAFTRRGYGGSGGRFVEKIRDWSRPALVRVGQIPAEDIREAVRLMGQKSYVDASKVIAVGISGGGYATIALAANPPPGLVAAINFAGGEGTSAPTLTDRVQENLAKAAATFGKTARVPMLWIYAENDHIATQAMAKQMFAAFTKAGGNAEFIAAPSFTTYKNEGHFLFRYGISVWAPYVDAFLEKQGLKLMDGLIPVSNMRIVTQGDKQ